MLLIYKPSNVDLHVNVSTPRMKIVRPIYVTPSSSWALSNRGAMTTHKKYSSRYLNMNQAISCSPQDRPLYLSISLEDPVEITTVAILKLHNDLQRLLLLQRGQVRA